MGAGGLINWPNFLPSFYRSPNKGGAQTDNPPYLAGFKFVDPPLRKNINNGFELTSIIKLHVTITGES